MDLVSFGCVLVERGTRSPECAVHGISNYLRAHVRLSFVYIHVCVLLLWRQSKVDAGGEETVQLEANISHYTKKRGTNSRQTAVGHAANLNR